MLSALKNLRHQRHLGAYSKSSKVPAQRLFPLKSLEQTLEVPSPKPIEILSLDYFNKDGRTVTHVLREDLQKISPFIEVDKNVVFLQKGDIFGNLNILHSQLLTHLDIVATRDGKKADAALCKAFDSFNNVIGSEGDVLTAGSSVVVHESRHIHKH